MVPRNSNSGVVLLGMYEIQVLDSYGRDKPKVDDMGAIYGQFAPEVNASKKPGEWQKLVVEYRAARYDDHGKKVANARLVHATLNDQPIHENVEIKNVTCAFFPDGESSTGPLLLQGTHGPVAFRNIRIKPLFD